jgi:hypothetical protein
MTLPVTQAANAKHAAVHPVVEFAVGSGRDLERTARQKAESFDGNHTITRRLL